MALEKLGIGTKVEHPKFGLGVVCNIQGDFYKIYFIAHDEVKSIGKAFDGLTITDRVLPEQQPLEVSDIKKAVRDVFEEFQEQIKPVTLGGKWIGGTVLIKPKTDDLQSKEIPISTFFHKIVMVRDRLRVLEQNINSHKKLEDEDKVHLQQYITRAYGSLTTFNVLFSHKEDQFKGSGNKR